MSATTHPPTWERRPLVRDSKGGLWMLFQTGGRRRMTNVFDLDRARMLAHDGMRAPVLGDWARCDVLELNVLIKDRARPDSSRLANLARLRARLVRSGDREERGPAEVIDLFAELKRRFAK